MNAASFRRLRNLLTAAGLFLATAAFALWQNTRIAVLWDISYLLDSSYRVSLGQVLYRDIPFSHAPLTFLIHAAIIRIFGRVYYPHIVCAALEAGTATVLTWHILLHLLRASTNPQANPGPPPLPSTDTAPLQAPDDDPFVLATLLATPLIVLGIYAIYPHPIYDSDCILAVLIAIYQLQRAGQRPLRNALAGAICVFPLFFKQNIGLPFLAATLLAVTILAALRHLTRTSLAPQLAFFLGALLSLAAALLGIHYTAGLRAYFFWTITFAAQRRLPGFSLILDTYRQTSLRWTIPAAIAAVVLLRAHRFRSSLWSRTTAFLLLAAPFLWTILSLFLNTDPDDRADQLLSLWPHLLLLAIALALANLRPSKIRTASVFNMLLPLILLATIHGAFLSQQLWGSTYAIWPLLILLIAALLVETPSNARPLAAIIAATLLLCGGLYAASHERLSYIHLDGALTRTTLPQLHGLATPGPYIPAFEELIRFTDTEIPAGDGILLLPGEGPFYFATGRTPQFPILLFDPATDPYTPRQTLDEARAHNIRWLIVTRNLQLTASPQPDLPKVFRALQQDFTPYRTLTNYNIYRRK